MRSDCKAWTKAELDFISANKDKMSVVEMAECLGRSRPSVYSKMSADGLTIRHPRKVNCDEDCFHCQFDDCYKCEGFKIDKDYMREQHAAARAASASGGKSIADISSARIKEGYENK